MDPLLGAFVVALSERLDSKLWTVGCHGGAFVGGCYIDMHVLVHRLISDDGNKWGVLVLDIERKDNMIVCHSPLMTSSLFGVNHYIVYDYADPNFDPDRFIGEMLCYVAKEYFGK